MSIISILNVNSIFDPCHFGVSLVSLLHKYEPVMYKRIYFVSCYLFKGFDFPGLNCERKKQTSNDFPSLSVNSEIQESFS